MNKKELAGAIASRSGLTRAEASRSLEAMLEAVSLALTNGDRITLSGFGIFEVRKRAGRNGRNPRTGQTLKIESARMPSFRASASLKERVNRGNT